MRPVLAALLGLLVLLLPALEAEDDKQGSAAKKSPPAFQFRTNPKVKSNIDIKEIVKGINQPGDPRDKLPPIYKPKIVSAQAAGRWLGNSERVLGIEIGGEARAYPILFMAIHEVCNDTLGGQPIAPNY
jgi:hypothetical protein